MQEATRGSRRKLLSGLLVPAVSALLVLLAIAAYPELTTTHEVGRHLSEEATGGHELAATTADEEGHVQKAATRRLPAEEEEHEESAAGSGTMTSAIMLLGMVVFVLLMFYLVNWPDPDIRDMTWRLISATTSIFIAVLWFEAIRKLLALWVGDLLGPDWVLSLLIFLSVWSVQQAQLHFFMGQKLHMTALSTIGAHVSGFAAIHTFSEIQTEEPFKRNAFMNGVVAVIFALVWVFLAFVSKHIRRSIKHSEHFPKEEEHEWVEQCEESENDVLAICLGKLFCNASRFALLGKLHEKEILLCDACPPPRMRTVVLMFALGVFFMGLVFFANIFHNRVAKFEDNPRVKRFVKISLATFAFSMSWTLLFANQWLFKVWDVSSHIQSPVMKMLLVALFLGVSSMVAIFVLDYLADHEIVDSKALRSVMFALGMLVGLSWEGSFDVATEALAEGLADEGDEESAKGTYYTALLHIILVMISYPAWRLYILPKTDPELAEIIGKFPPLSHLWSTEDVARDSGSDEEDQGKADLLEGDVRG
mmetsp:Transcript_52377/g.94269  ORF Transcript_52377/g.94269 Transcript_52377/m.94269 type:complete len:535 (-) Transcript_52377:83-1687(-)